MEHSDYEDEQPKQSKFEEALDKSVQLFEQTLPIVEAKFESALTKFIGWLDSKLSK